jgi:kelch-like protein 10
MMGAREAKQSGSAPASPSSLGECVSIASNSVPIAFPKAWDEFRLHQQLCDGILHSNDGNIFYIHRIILCAASTYFKALFTNNLKGGEPEINEVNLDIPGHILDLILDYAYTGHCNVTSENVEQLLSTAHQYGVLGVLHQCSEYLLEELQPENCIGIFKLARQYFLPDLEDRRRRYICHNFKQILLHSPEFKDLSAEELEDILSDDELNVDNEGVVFEAVIKWAEADLQAREQYLRTLIHCVRYGLTSLRFFTDVMDNQLILANPELRISLYPAYVFLAEHECEEECDHPIARPRIPYEIVFAFGGWSNAKPTRLIETYDVRADEWLISKNTDHSPRAYHGVCTLDNLIYVVGGFDGSEHLSTVRCYNPVTQEWQDRACMYHARCYVSVCSLGGKIYAFGGFDGMIRKDSAERYSPCLNQWEMIPSMHRPRSDASATSLNGKIYIVGGFDGEEVMSSAEVFDPDTNEWTFIHPMESPRSGVRLVAYNNFLYAIGGFDEFTRLASGERYNPSCSSGWQEISEMFSPRSNFAAVVLDDMIFVFGGFNGMTTIADGEYYDVHSDEWYETSSMNLNRSALSACVLAGLPNAREYSRISRTQEMHQGTSSDFYTC